MCLNIETTNRFTYRHYQTQITYLKQAEFSGFLCTKTTFHLYLEKTYFQSQ